MLLLAIVLMNRRITNLAQSGAAGRKCRLSDGAARHVGHQGGASLRQGSGGAHGFRHPEHGRACRHSASASTPLQTAFAAGTSLVLALGTAAVLWVGTQHVWSNALTVGDVVVFISYLASLYCSDQLANSDIRHGAGRQGRSGARCRNTQRRADGTRRHTCVPYASTRPRAARRRGVQPETPEGQTLHDITIEAQPGEAVATVGPTGAGKSTLVSLIPRFYDPTHGRVLIDDTDIRTLRLAALRAQISMVLQPLMVFPLTIRENIAYGRPTASFEEICRAARLAQADAFIERLPQAYDTVIGEQGATLSEGERQRLTIARALLRDAPILILDGADIAQSIPPRRPPSWRRSNK